MSGRKAKAARKAQREPGEPHYKEPIRNPGRYLTKPEREERRQRELAAKRKKQGMMDAVARAADRVRNR